MIFLPSMIPHCAIISRGTACSTARKSSHDFACSHSSEGSLTFLLFAFLLRLNVKNLFFFVYIALLSSLWRCCNKKTCSSRVSLKEVTRVALCVGVPCCNKRWLKRNCRKPQEWNVKVTNTKSISDSDRRSEILPLRLSWTISIFLRNSEWFKKEFKNHQQNFAQTTSFE